MEIFGQKIIDADQYERTEKQLNETKETIEEQQELIKKLETEISTIPDQILGSTRGRGKAQFFDTPQSIRQIGRVAKTSDLLRNILQTIKTETFRNGFQKQPAQGYDEMNEAELNRLQDVMRKANSNGQNLKDVLKSFEDDLNTYDDAFLLISQDYSWRTEDRNLTLTSTVSELVTLNPAYVGLMIDKAGRLGYDEDGQKVYVSPMDRTELIEGEAEKNRAIANGKPVFRVGYAFNGPQTDKITYYGTDEVIHKHKYTESLTRGTSPIISVWTKTRALQLMDDFIKDYYEERRNPKGMLIVNTKNQKSLKDAWEKWKERTRENPHLVNPLGLKGEDTGNMVEYIDFMNSLEDMQYTATRNEFRKQVGALFYVSPVFMNDTDGGGGLNNEGLQITVTNRGMELAQETYNEPGGVLDRICKAFGFDTIDLQLAPTEKMDERTEEDIRQAKLQNAEQAAKLGLDTKYTEDGDLVIKPGTVETPSAQPETSGEGNPSPPESQVREGEPREASKELPFGDGSFEDCQDHMMEEQGYSENEAARVCGAIEQRIADASKSDEESDEDMGSRFRQKQLSEDRRKPNEGMMKAAQQALDWADKHDWEKTSDSSPGTRVGWERANQITNNESLSEDTWQRMHSFFERHGDNVTTIDSEYKGEPHKDHGYVAGLLWGGEAGKRKAERINEAIDEDKSLTSLQGDKLLNEYKRINKDTPTEYNEDEQRVIRAMANEEIRSLTQARDFTITKDSLGGDIEDSVEEFLGNFDERRPSKDELMEMAENVSSDLKDKVQSTVQSLIEPQYDEVYEQTTSQFDGDFQRDNGLRLAELLDQPVLKQSSKEIAEDTENKLKEVLEKHYESGGNINSQEVIDDIQDVTDFARSRAQNIARTEGAKVQNAARRDAYEDAEQKFDQEFLYEHVGPDDNRTTETSKRIKDRTQGGVPWNEYVEIVREESKKDFPDWRVDKDKPVSHYQSRHTFVRTVGSL